MNRRNNPVDIILDVIKITILIILGYIIIKSLIGVA